MLMIKERKLHNVTKCAPPSEYEYGQRTYIKYGNDVETTYIYDENRRWLSSIKTTSAYGVLQNIIYSFDKVGNVLGYTNTSGSYSTSQKYSYDDLYQLTKASGTTNGLTIGNQSYTATYTQKFSFDTQGLGNMTKKESSQASNRSFVIGSDLNYTYDYEYESGFVHRAKRIGQNYYKYDLNGNLSGEQQEPFTAAQSQDHEVTRLDDNTYTSDYGWGLEEDGFGQAASDKQKKAGRTYTWNEKNELSVSADSRYNVNYIYGEGGERTAKVAHSSTGTTSETLYFNKMYSWHYDGAISDYTGNYSKNIFLGETRILTKVNRADTFTSEEYAKQYWYHSDHLGSASLITDYQGREYERIEYTPYGELWVERKTPTDNLDTIFRFSGKELDAETGNYYYGARYLDPRTSRWLSTDPALGEYIPGAPVNDEAKKRNGNLPGMGGVFNVVNFHLYHYAGNNPVKYVDPTGRTATYSIDEENKTININVDITVHGNVDNLQQIANEYKTGIDAAWGKDSNGNAWQMNINGSDYSVNFNVNVTIGDAPDAETELYNAIVGTQNFVNANPSTPESSVFRGYLGNWRTKGRQGLPLNIDNPAGHEYGHLLGLLDIKGSETNIMGNGLNGCVEQQNIDALGGYISSQKGREKGILRFLSGGL